MGHRLWSSLTIRYAQQENMNQDAPMKIAISIGDLAGIGSEVVIKSLANRELVESCIPIIYANNGFIMEVCNKLGVQDFQIHKIEAPFEAEQGKVNVLQSWEETAEVDFGSPSEQSGQYALKSLEQAVQDLSNAKVDALVTAPIDKHNIQSERFQFPGHTEYLASVADAEDYLMLLVSGSLR
ncbi:MAG: hypothetical protein HKO93_05535, partial [Flavobacteriales bacterium]|nr:hypothetical protein [Flavobacteriales bacterium]